MEEKERKTSAPKINTRLRHNILEMPPCIRNASGIVIYGRRIKSIVFTTDLAIIRNCDADAVFAVYPFTPQQVISDAIIKASYIPVFCGVGGGTTILNVACAQDTPEVVADIRRKFPDIPIIASGEKSEESIMKTINAGANAITYTPPSTQDLFKEMMSKYRE